jgi:hypothetical protein
MMARNRLGPPFRRTSVRVLVGGTALFFLLVALVRGLGNPTDIPIVIIVGAFVVPVAFVAYIYEREPGRHTRGRGDLCFLGAPSA